MQNEKLVNAKVFFQEHSVYERLFLLFRKKYESIGKIGGTVSLNDFSDLELDELALFFGTSKLELQKKGKILIQAFQQQLEKTKFEGICLFQLLQFYFDEEILTKQQQKDKRDRFFYDVFTGLKRDYSKLTFWFNYLEKKTADTYWIYRLIENKAFVDYVVFLDKAFAALPKEGERLAMFSQRITGNPHAFDIDKELGKLLLHLLAVHEDGQFKNEVRTPTDSEGISQLLENYLLFRDDITNFVTIANFLAETRSGVDTVWHAAATKSIPAVLNVPIRELTSIIKVYPNSACKTVWIVENSGVFSTILDKYPKVPLMCTHGQFKLASLKLMDLLVANGCLLMYAGDFDPEGLSMLQRLKQRYHEQVIPWRMDAIHYEKANPTVELAEERLSKLNNITLAELAEVKEKILQLRKASYQEALVNYYFEDL